MKYLEQKEDKNNLMLYGNLAWRQVNWCKCSQKKSNHLLKRKII